VVKYHHRSKTIVNNLKSFGKRLKKVKRVEILQRKKRKILIVKRLIFVRQISSGVDCGEGRWDVRDKIKKKKEVAQG